MQLTENFWFGLVFLIGCVPRRLYSCGKNCDFVDTSIWICHTIRHGTFTAFRVFSFSLEVELISNQLLLKMFIFPLWWVDQSLTESDRGFVCFSLMYRELSRNMWGTGLDVFHENTYIKNRFLYMWLLSLG